MTTFNKLILFRACVAEYILRSLAFDWIVCAHGRMCISGHTFGLLAETSDSSFYIFQCVYFLIFVIWFVSYNHLTINPFATIAQHNDSPYKSQYVCYDVVLKNLVCHKRSLLFVNSYDLSVCVVWRIL